MGTSLTITYASGQYFCLPLSNGAAEALLCALTVAGSRELAELQAELAEEGVSWAELAWETSLLTFFASHDRKILHNSEGFDLGRLGWQAADFAAQKQTLLHYIELALMYSARDIGELFNTQRLMPNLGALRAMLWNMGPEDIPADPAFAWPLPPPAEIALCPAHRVFLHSAGCLICHLSGG